MTPRQRFIETLTFGRPDRIPFQPGQPRESTLRAWRTQGLPADTNWHDKLLREVGIQPEPARPIGRLDVDFRMIPQFPEEVLEHRGGHFVVQDWKGNICEIADNFDVTYLRTAKDFVTRRWIKCPVETRDDWKRMKLRYNVDDPERFPADLAERGRRLAGRDQVLAVSFNGPFWQLREWCGFEGLCLLMIEQPDFVAEMAQFWMDFVSAVLERLLAHVVPDHVLISEDMAYKQHSMVSPTMVRRFCQPSYRCWASQLTLAGVPILDVDSDGHVGELIPIWIESGINTNDPLEVAAGNDINVFQKQFGQSMAFRGGVDKRAMAAGGQAIRDELARLELALRRGGYIPSCDHGVPSDVSWPNFVDYARLLAKMTGWL